MIPSILIALLAVLIVALLAVRAWRAPSRERARRRSAARGTAARRRPEAPYVSASLRGMTQPTEARSRRTSGLG
jgi:peptidoglycan/LPS O-acetylase OafA/YrhL